MKCLDYTWPASQAGVKLKLFPFRFDEFIFPKQKLLKCQKYLLQLLAHPSQDSNISNGFDSALW